MANKTTVYPLQQDTNVDVGATPVEVLVDGTNQTVESTTQAIPIEIVVPETTIYTVGIQGPQGPAGSEDEVAKAKRIDFEGDYIYKGRAEPGTADATAGWEIQRIEKVTGADGVIDYVYTYATVTNNVASKTNKWTDRLTLTYT